ncbi:hypothetical protein EBB07_04620 [Paenibacillaceae bacterium]|nr:hypothetical protein EBB07_04620 [Paenibacillaceae bacterium]
MSIKNFKVGVPAEDGQLSLMFTKGGPRQGAGRKGFGDTRKVSLTLPPEIWDALEQRQQALNCSRSEALREIVTSFFHTDAAPKERNADVD